VLQPQKKEGKNIRLHMQKTLPNVEWGSSSARFQGVAAIQRLRGFTHMAELPLMFMLTLMMMLMSSISFCLARKLATCALKAANWRCHK